jgi:glycine betaine/choline ABC-type transport system substrate-binding protein/serine/threonine protein kinase
MEDKGAGNSCPHCGYKQGDTPESLLHLPPGTVLQNKYLLGRVLGQGGFGITYLAWDLTLNIKLAIKEYLPQQLATRSAGQNTVTFYKSTLAEEFRYGLNKFLEEARTLARFNEHPNIVTVRDYFEANGTAYLVMNYHEGITLQNYLVSKGGKIPVEQALAIFMPVLDALMEVHAAGILHRDISPDNLLIEKTGRVILIDFGAARQAMGEKSKSLSVIMKAGYSPPEQYQSRGKQGPWTDIYAVAASFYRAITGVAPAEAFDRVMEDSLDNPSTLGIEIDNKVEEALLKALAVKTGERYQTVEQFQKALVASLATGQFSEGYAEIKPMWMADSSKAEVIGNEKELKEIAQVGDKAEVAMATNKKLGTVQQPASRSQKSEPAYTASKKALKLALVAIICGLLIFGAFSLFGGSDDTAGPTVPGVEDVVAGADDVSLKVAGMEEPSTIILAAKGWSENMTLGYMAALLIEANTVHSVDTSKINMGPTEMLHPALVEGQIDIYPEYTGTSWMVVLGNEEVISDRREIYEASRDAYLEQFGIVMLEPIGFQNTFAITMTAERAAELGVTKLSELAAIPDLTFIGDNTTFTRPDLYLGLGETYGIDMDSVNRVIVDTSFFYEALVQGSGDIATLFSTDGKLYVYDFVIIEDDKNFFSPFDAIYVLRPGLLDEYPSIAEALAPLLGSIDEATMIELNYKVEVEMQDPEDVARDYLESVGLI